MLSFQTSLFTRQLLNNGSCMHHNRLLTRSDAMLHEHRHIFSSGGLCGPRHEIIQLCPVHNLLLPYCRCHSQLVAQKITYHPTSYMPVQGVQLYQPTDETCNGICPTPHHKTISSSDIILLPPAGYMLCSALLGCVAPWLSRPLPPVLICEHPSVLGQYITGKCLGLKLVLCCLDMRLDGVEE